MLHLILSDRNKISVKKQNIGRHQNGVSVKPHIHSAVGIFALFNIGSDRRLVRVRPIHQPFRGKSAQKRCQFENLRNIRLPVKQRFFGIQSARHPRGGDCIRVAPKLLRIFDRIERMIIGNKVTRLKGSGCLQCGADSSEPVSDMRRSRRLNTCQKNFIFRFFHYFSPLSTFRIQPATRPRPFLSSGSD